MKQKLPDDDIDRMRRLFWMKYRGEITQAELESRVSQIADRQMKLPEKSEKEEYAHAG